MGTIIYSIYTTYNTGIYKTTTVVLVAVITSVLHLPRLLRSVGHSPQVDEGPGTVDDCGDHYAPAPVDAGAQDVSRKEGCGDIAYVLMAGP